MEKVCAFFLLLQMFHAFYKILSFYKQKDVNKMKDVYLTCMTALKKQVFPRLLSPCR